MFDPMGVLAIAGYHVKLRVHRMRSAYQIEDPRREALAANPAPRVSALRGFPYGGSV